MSDATQTNGTRNPESYRCDCCRAPHQLICGQCFVEDGCTHRGCENFPYLKYKPLLTPQVSPRGPPKRKRDEQCNTFAELLNDCAFSACHEDKTHQQAAKLVDHFGSLNGLQEEITNDKDAVREFLLRTVKIPYRQCFEMLRHPDLLQ